MSDSELVGPRRSEPELNAAGGILLAGVLLFPARRRLPLAGLAVADVFRLPITVNVVLAAPGAWLVSQAPANPLPGWVSPTFFVFLTVARPLLARFDRDQDRPPLGPIFLALAIGAAFLTLPDTEEILVLVPIAAAAALTGWPLQTLRLGAAGSYASLGLLIAVSAWDGRGRVASIIGVIATLTVPLIGVLVTSVTKTEITPSRAFTLTLIHLGTVLVATRVVGLRDSVEIASTLGVVTFVVTTGVLTVLALDWSPPD